MLPKGRTFQQFMGEVKGLCENRAREKRYSQTGVDGQNHLYEFVQDLSGGHQHALGEIVYKVKRFAAKGNEEDILKVAAWAYLIWKHHRCASSM